VKKPPDQRNVATDEKNFAPGSPTRDRNGAGIHFSTPAKSPFCGRLGFFTDPGARGSIESTLQSRDRKGAVITADGHRAMVTAHRRTVPVCDHYPQRSKENAFEVRDNQNSR
jgi:hypothetical protein